MTKQEESLVRLKAIRSEIEAAAERKMRLPRNMAKGTWEAASLNYLVNRLYEELREFLVADGERMSGEAGDVLNFMAMILDYKKPDNLVGHGGPV